MIPALSNTCILTLLDLRDLLTINGFHEKKDGGKVVGRMYALAPNDHTKCYTRMLILRTKGAVSFADLRSYNSVTYHSYRKATLGRGLLEDDTEKHKCLEEMDSTHVLRELRDLFVLI